MRNNSEPSAYSSPKRRRRTSRVVLGAAIATVVAASGVYIVNADAAETVVPGRLQAEAFAAQSGAQTQNTGDTDGGKNVGWLANGDWLRYDNVDLGVAGALTMTARIASDSSAAGSVELHTGSLTGALLATFPVASTGGWQRWVTKTATAVTHPAGKQTVFAALKSAQRGDFVNLNWFTFGGAGAATPAPSASSPATPPSSAPGSAPSSTPGSTAPAPSGAGWVTVDPAKWAAQLAAFKAMPMKADHRQTRYASPSSTPPARSATPSRTTRSSSPGWPARRICTRSWATTAPTRTPPPTRCSPTPVPAARPGEDHSAYWIPSLTENGKTVEPHGVTVYYGSRLKDPTATVPFPQGFRMIAGDAKRQVGTPAGAPGQFWCAGAGGEIGRSADGNWPVCAKTAELTFQLTFPDCWDGVHLDSPDHKSHVGGTGPDGTCASGKFPLAIPSLSFVIGYPTSGSAAGFKLSSGNASSMHGDAFFAWEDAALSHRVKDCIVQKAKCNTAGGF